jgi:hypothetical protein
MNSDDGDGKRKEPKLTEIATPANPYIKGVIISDDGHVEVMYHGCFFVNFETRGGLMSDEPVLLGTNLQIRRVK